MGGPVVKIGVHIFEMHPYCGPIRCNKDGEPSAKDFGPRSSFWPLFERWQAGGEIINSNGNGVILPPTYKPSIS